MPRVGAGVLARGVGPLRYERACCFASLGGPLSYCLRGITASDPRLVKLPFLSLLVCAQVIDELSSGGLADRDSSHLIFCSLVGRRCRCAMGRRGWTAMEVPSGRLQVLRDRDRLLRDGRRRRRCRRIPVQFSSESVSLAVGWRSTNAHAAVEWRP